MIDTSNKEIQSHYDFIVVGAGAAGSVIFVASIGIRLLRQAIPCSDAARCSGDRSRSVWYRFNQYHATTHFVGQSTIFTLTDERATGVAYCLAHHVTVEGNERGLMLASLRYLDTFTKVDGSWLFAERQLYVDWLEQRAMS